MQYRYPHYYKQFQCSATDCEATCCAGWEIVIDEESIEKYLNVKTDFGNRLCNSIDFQEGVFHQNHMKRCAFLNDDNLCDIYSELGEEALCYTCTQYPRHIEEFEEVNEVSLSISCPVVAQMILKMEEKVTFYEEEMEETIEPFEEFDFLFYEILVEVRQVLFEILQNRLLNIKERMTIAQKMCEEMQEKINTFEIFTIEEVMEKYRNGNMAVDTADEKSKSEDEDINKQRAELEKRQGHFMELYQLEMLQDGWQAYLLECQIRLYGLEFVEYRNLKEQFQNTYGEILQRMEEQLMVYFIFSYFCGAVYDGELFAKYQIAHVTTEILEELWFAKYLENHGQIAEDEMCRIAYQYAREIEHSDQNLDLLEALYQL